MESRRKIGYDSGDYQQWPDGAKATNLGHLEEGVLVYSIIAKIETGQLPLRVVGDPGTGQVADYPIGERLVGLVEGVSGYPGNQLAR